jgi:hypothetical protein
MSGPNQGWNPDGTPAGSSSEQQDQSAPGGNQQPAQPYQGQYPSAAQPSGQQPYAQEPYAQEPYQQQTQFQPPPYQQPQQGWSGMPGDQSNVPPPYGQTDPQQGQYYPGPSQPYYPPPQPPAKRRPWLGIVVILIIAVVIGGGFFLLRDRLGGDVTSLAAGECFDEPALDTEIDDVQRQPCNEPHDAEVIAALTHPAPSGEAYPVVSGFDDYILENCVPIFETYLGIEWDTDTTYRLGYFRPTLTGWGEGDRGFTCYVTRLDGTKLTASVKKS